MNLKDRPHIIFIGQMGSGKTFHGKALSKLIGYPFVDLDDAIAQHAGMSVASIFASYGEDHFRVLEQKSLRDELAETESKIIACGGGTPCFFDNMTQMNRSGVTIYLETPPTLLAQRLLAGRLEDRPLLKDLPNQEALEEFLKHQLEERKGYYERAHLSFSQNSNHQDVAKEIAHYLEQIIGH